MDTLTTQQLSDALRLAAAYIVEAEPYLTEVDTVIGDGDHGEGMKIGFTALGIQLDKENYATPYALLHASGLCLVRTMGGASGVLFGTLFIGGLEAVKGKNVLSASDLAAFFDQSIAAVQQRGRTGPGGKTMVDALVEANEAMKNKLAGSKQIEDILCAAYLGATAGMEKTKDMLPQAGRSKNFREKALGYPDPGAISVSIIFKGLYEAIMGMNTPQ